MALTNLKPKKSFWERHPRFDLALAVAMVIAAIAISAFVLSKGFL